MEQPLQLSSTSSALEKYYLVLDRLSLNQHLDASECLDVFKAFGVHAGPLIIDLTEEPFETYDHLLKFMELLASRTIISALGLSHFMSNHKRHLIPYICYNP